MRDSTKDLPGQPALIMRLLCRSAVIVLWLRRLVARGEEVRSQLAGELATYTTQSTAAASMAAPVAAAVSSTTQAAYDLAQRIRTVSPASVTLFSAELVQELVCCEALHRPPPKVVSNVTVSCPPIRRFMTYTETPVPRRPIPRSAPSPILPGHDGLHPTIGVLDGLRAVRVCDQLPFSGRAAVGVVLGCGGRAAADGRGIGRHLPLRDAGRQLDKVVLATVAVPLRDPAGR